MDETGAKKIVINGQSYERVEDMPPEIRDVYERAMSMLSDADRNGVPDILEGKGAGFWQTAKQVWSLGRDAHRAGIHSVDLSRVRSDVREARSGAPLADGAASSDRFTRDVRDVRTVGAGPLPHGPVEVGGAGRFGKLLLAVIGAAIVALVLQQLGVIE